MTARGRSAFRLKPACSRYQVALCKAPEVRYGKLPMMRPSFASWNPPTTQLVRPATLGRWAYLVLSLEDRPMTWSTRDEFHGAMDRLMLKLTTLGIRCAKYIPGQTVKVRSDDAAGRIAEAVQKFAMNPQQRPQFILVVLPSNQATAIYNKLKYSCDVQFGLLNVCVVEQQVCRSQRSVFGKRGVAITASLRRSSV